MVAGIVHNYLSFTCCRIDRDLTIDAANAGNILRRTVTTILESFMPYTAGPKEDHCVW